MKEKIVRIEWVDSCSDTGWTPRDYANDESCVAECESVGFLLKKNKKELTIFLSKSHTSGQVTETMTIPRSCVKKITYLGDIDAQSTRGQTKKGST